MRTDEGAYIIREIKKLLQFLKKGTGAAFFILLPPKTENVTGNRIPATCNKSERI